jgi:hypothetical protein
MTHIQWLTRQVPRIQLLVIQIITAIKVAVMTVVMVPAALVRKEL